MRAVLCYSFDLRKHSRDVTAIAELYCGTATTHHSCLWPPESAVVIRIEGPKRPVLLVPQIKSRSCVTSKTTVGRAREKKNEKKEARIARFPGTFLAFHFQFVFLPRRAA